MALQSPAALGVHEGLIAVIKFNVFISDGGRCQFTADVLVLAHDSPVAGTELIFSGQNADADTGGAALANGTKQLPAKAAVSAAQQFTVGMRGYVRVESDFE